MFRPLYVVHFKRALNSGEAQVQTEARFFTVEEVGKIIAAAREPYKTMFWLLAMTVMRACVMLGLPVGRREKTPTVPRMVKKLKRVEIA
jgi:hypothetical protein